MPTENPTAAYWDTVNAIAEEAHALPEDERADFVAESVDGNHYVIYTYANAECLVASENEDAAFEEMGSNAVGGCDSYSAVMTRLAYFAMLADVNDRLGRMGDDDTDDNGGLTEDDIAHLTEECERRNGDAEDEGGPEPVMTSIGYVDLWKDGDVITNGVTIANVAE
jgi:hypothetical protein